MNHYVALTDFHVRLLQAITDEEVIVVPRSNQRRRWLRAAPTVLRALVRCLVDPTARVIVSHPFNPVAALFLACARQAAFFDDGVAYYADSPIPRSRKSAVYRWLTRRHIDWDQVRRSPNPGYGTVLAAARIDTMYALFPDLLQAPHCRLVEIEGGRGRAAARELPGDSAGAILFLDTREEYLRGVDQDGVIALLADRAREGSGQIFFKAHPSQRSSLSRRLDEQAWAREVTGVLEEWIDEERIDEVYSFSSSGALSVAFVHPRAKILTLRSPAFAADSQARLTALFDKIGAVDVAL